MLILYLVHVLLLKRLQGLLEPHGKSCHLAHIHATIPTILSGADRGR
jgi:hypothetical protein